MWILFSFLRFQRQPGILPRICLFFYNINFLKLRSKPFLLCKSWALKQSIKKKINILQSDEFLMWLFYKLKRIYSYGNIVCFIIFTTIILYSKPLNLIALVWCSGWVVQRCSWRCHVCAWTTGFIARPSSLGPAQRRAAQTWLDSGPAGGGPAVSTSALVGQEATGVLLFAAAFSTIH